MLNERSSLYKAIALLSNSLTSFATEDTQGRKKVVQEITALEAQVALITPRLDVYFSTKTLPPPIIPESSEKPAVDLSDAAACLRRRNALHRTMTYTRQKLSSDPNNPQLISKMEELKSELETINQALNSH